MEPILTHFVNCHNSYRCVIYSQSESNILTMAILDLGSEWSYKCK